jgi:hypothetical protein
MFNVIHKYKGSHVLFATVKPDGKYHVNFSAYGNLVSDLLEKYLEGQRDDNEERFTEWDGSYKEAISKPGFSTTHEVEDGYIYISTFQNGIGITPEDKARPGREAIRGVGVRLPAFQSDIEDGFEKPEDDSDNDYEE